MSSKITINISVQPDEKSQISMKRETDENFSVSKSAPLPPEIEDMIIEESDFSSEISPAPPQDPSMEQYLEWDQYSSPPPPKFLDEDPTVSVDEDVLAPAPPSDHPVILEEGETGESGEESSSPEPPTLDEGNNKTENTGKGKSSGKKKNKKK